MAKLVEGNVFEIQDVGYGYYYSVICRGGNVGFYDVCATRKLSLNQVVTHKVFLRLEVVCPSIKRAKWQNIGLVELKPPLNQYSMYKHTPVNADPLLHNSETGESTKVVGEELEGLELLAVWDAEEHILPVLRYHFYRTDPPPFLHMIAAKV